MNHITENNSNCNHPIANDTSSNTAITISSILLISTDSIVKALDSFTSIAAAQPDKLYLAASNSNIDELQSEILSRISKTSWNCSLQVFSFDDSLSYKDSVISSIDWFFSNEEKGIIIEDGITASASFFSYASQLLDYYKDDRRIMSISGNNFSGNQFPVSDSYYYSQIHHLYGWATWRRAWSDFKNTIKILPGIIEQLQSGNIPSLTHNATANQNWYNWLINAFNSNVDAWDYLWAFNTFINSGLSCIPSVNLTTNINSDNYSLLSNCQYDFSTLTTEQTASSITHPSFLVYSKVADNFYYNHFFPLQSNKPATPQVQSAPENNQPRLFQNNGALKVLIISSKDSGGAGGAARRMHEALLNQNIDSVMLVLDKQTDTPHIAQINQNIPNLDRSKPSAQLFYAFNIIQSKLSQYPKRNNLEMFTTTESIISYKDLAPYIQQADIINVHWIDGFFDYYNAPDAFQGKHIVWTLHDMYQFTGGCHYAFSCENYTIGCKGCPQMGSDDFCEITQNSHNIKMHAYQRLNISYTTPSAWLDQCAQDSLLMKGMRSKVVPNVFDINKFKPVDQNQARTELNLPLDKAVILFGADSLLRPAKNLSALIKALNELCISNTINADNIVLVVFGAGSISHFQTPYQIIELGTLSTSEKMSQVYSAADFTVVPSLSESFSYLKFESLACGTPIVGFAVTGMPYLMENNQTGYLATPFNIEELKEGILWGLNVARNNSQIRNKCREIIETNLNEERVTGSMISFFKEVLNSPLIDHKSSETNIESNDSLRSRYINTILNTQNSISDTAAAFTSEICNWLVTNLLPHRNLTQDELKLKADCLNLLASSDTDNAEYLKALLLAVVLIPAEELPLTLDVFSQPENVHKLLIQYIFTFKEIPSYSGFVDNTLKHMQAYLEMLKAEQCRKPASALSLILNSFNTLRKIPIYCANSNLKKVMSITAEMMRDLLLLNNAKVDFDFPPRNPSRKIRLGILLQAITEHTETYATLPVFTHLNKDEFEIFAFVLKKTNSSQEIQYRDCYDHLIEISATVIPKSVSQIREADLDILLIGTNITALANHNALIATHRLARIQAIHFCNPCTTGIKNIDYFITGDYFSLSQNDFTEKLIYNKHSGICFENNTIVKPATLKLSRRDLGIPENTIAFVTGANYYKFTYELREFWARILKAIPNSCLITFPFGPAWTDKYPVREFNDSIRNQLSDCGIDADRLIILKPLPTRQDVRQAVGLCDIYLDSFPYSGATSLPDPLTPGVPVIYMKPNSVRGGQGSGMLEDMNLSELVVNNKDEYFDLAVKLANDIEYRNCISATITEKMSQNPLFLDTEDYCADMDRIYKTMLHEYDNKSLSTDSNLSSSLPFSTSADLNTTQKPNDICNCGSGLKYKKCCGKKK